MSTCETARKNGVACTAPNTHIDLYANITQQFLFYGVVLVQFDLALSVPLMKNYANRMVDEFGCNGVVGGRSSLRNSLLCFLMHGVGWFFGGGYEKTNELTVREDPVLFERFPFFQPLQNI